MKKPTILIFAIILLFVVIVIAFYQNRSDNEAPIAMDYCTEASDCVPAECCHPDSVVNEYYAPNCAAVSCTFSCEGPLDCDAGRIECIENKCTIVSND